MRNRRSCRSCGRLATEGTWWCKYHGGRRRDRQLACDLERLEAAAVEYRRWLTELEGRWVALGRSPVALRHLVAEGREVEVARWVERAEAGW